MPTSGSGIHPLTWKDLSDYERKQFYRENERRVRIGLNPLNKESVNLSEIRLMSAEKKVEAIRINGKITKEVLLELGADENIEGYLIVCRWKSGGYSVGWSDMDQLELAHSLLHLDHEIKCNLFGGD